MSRGADRCSDETSSAGVVDEYENSSLPVLLASRLRYRADGPESGRLTSPRNESKVHFSSARATSTSLGRRFGPV